MADAAKLILQLEARGIKLTKSELKSLDAQVKTTSSSFGGMVTAMAAVTTAGLAFRSIVQTGKDFEFQMAKVGAVSGASERELRKLTEQARNLGGTTANTAAEIGGLQENLARLGFPTEQILGMTGAIQALSYATVTDLAESAEIVGQTMNAYGLQATEAAHVSDVFAEATASSALNMTRLSDSMSYVGSVAGNLGFSLEDTVALLGKLHDNAITGSMAGTALRKMMLELSNESSKLAQHIGFPVRNMDDLQKAVVKLKEDGFDPMVDGAELVGPRVVAAMSIIFNNMDGIDTLTEKLDNSSEAFGGMGAAAEQASKIQDTLQGDLDNLNSALSDLQIAVFDDMNDFLRSSTQALTDFIRELDVETLKTYTAQLVTFLAVYKGGPAIISLYTNATSIATMAQKTFNFVVKKNPYVAAGIALATLTGYVLDYFGVFEEKVDQQKGFNDALLDQIDISRQLIVDVSNLQTNQKDATEMTKEDYEALLVKIQTQKNLIKSNEDVIDSTDDIGNMYDSTVRSLRHMIRESDSLFTSNEHLKASSKLLTEEINNGSVSIDTATAFLTSYQNAINDVSSAEGTAASTRDFLTTQTTKVSNVQEKVNTLFGAYKGTLEDALLEDAKKDESNKSLLDGMRKILAELEQTKQQYESLDEAEKKRIESMSALELALSPILAKELEMKDAMVARASEEAGLALIEARRVGIVGDITQAELDAAMASAKRGESQEAIIQSIINAGNEEEIQSKKTIYFNDLKKQQLEATNQTLEQVAIQAAIAEDSLQGTANTTEQSVELIKTFLQTVENADPKIAAKIAFDSAGVEDFEANMAEFQQVLAAGGSNEIALKFALDDDVSLESLAAQVGTDLETLKDAGITPEMLLTLKTGDEDAINETLSRVNTLIEEEELGITIPVSFLNPETGEEEVEYFTVDQQNKAQENFNNFMNRAKGNQRAMLDAEKATQLEAIKAHQNYKEAEAEINKVYNAKKLQIVNSEIKMIADQINNVGSMMVQGNDLDKGQKKTVLKIMKIAAIGQAISGAMSAFSNTPFPANVAALAATLATGYTQVKNIESQEKALDGVSSGQGTGTVNPEYASSEGATQTLGEGGLIQGPSHMAGGVPILAEGGEYVIQKSSVSKYGKNYLDSLNQGVFDRVGMPVDIANDLVNTMHFGNGGMVGDLNKPTSSNMTGSSINNTTNINISAPVLDETVVDEIIPRIRKAIAQGESLNENEIDLGVKSGKVFGD